MIPAGLDIEFQNMYPAAMSPIDPYVQSTPTRKGRWEFKEYHIYTARKSDGHGDGDVRPFTSTWVMHI